MTEFFDTAGVKFPDAWKETIWQLRADIERDRAATFDRIERIRQDSGGRDTRDFERNEWRLFSQRNHFIEQEIELLTRKVAAWVGLQAPPPVAVDGQ